MYRTRSKLSRGGLMKTRQGFVSNSSSTSFCIYGVYLDEDDMFHAKEKFNYNWQ